MAKAPHNEDAEQAVLGAAMLSPDAAADVVHSLTQDDFYVPGHQAVFSAIWTLTESGNPVDIQTVTEFLRSTNELDKFGGVRFVTDMTDNVVTTNTTEHVGIVKELSVRRHWLDAGQRIGQLARTNKPIDTILDEIEALRLANLRLAPTPLEEQIDRVPTQGVDITYAWQGWKLRASWPQRGSKHEIVVQLSVRYTGVGGRLVMSTKRINLLSNSAVAGIAVSMRKAVPHQADVVDELVHVVIEDLIEWYRQGRGIERPDPTKLAGPAGWILYPVWPAAGATAITGGPGTLKSFLAQGVALSVATGATILSRNTRPKVERQVLYLDWEADQSAFQERLAALCIGAGIDLAPWLGYKQMTARLSDVAIATAEELTQGGFTAVIIDSMSAAIGGGLVDDDSVNAFWDGIRLLGVPALVIAHKSAENIARRNARFFGSIMSEARVRMAWNVERSPASPHVVWQCFKDNNTGHLWNKLAWLVELESQGEHDERHLASVAFTGINPDNVMLQMPGTETEQVRRPPRSTQADQIADVLQQEGPMTTGGIAAKLRMTTAQVRAVVSRYNDRFSKSPGGLWTCTEAGETTGPDSHLGSGNGTDRPVPY